MNEKKKQSILRWRERNPEQWREIKNAVNRRHRKRHIKAIRAYSKRYRAANRERARLAYKKYYRKLRQEILEVYGRKCALCKEREENQLTIDHLHNDGQAHRRHRGRNWYVDVRREGFPKHKYRILCRRCNIQQWRKSLGKKRQKTRSKRILPLR